jgi:Coenzyme F420-reducing hydrogenase, beta subunit
MLPDPEGFLYPQTDIKLCTGCEECEKVCPARSNAPEKKHAQIGCAVQHINRTVLKRSTSGGAFSAIAGYVLRNGGVVFGAVMSDNYKVVHACADSFTDLARMRGSKYVQSDIDDSYIAAERYLKAGRMVCFSGTPCQIEGLLAFLGVSYPILITVDIVCRAVGSPKIWDKYTKMRQESVSSKITRFSFRDKTAFGYQMSTMSAYCGEELMYCGGIATDPYLRAFFSNICDRPSCYDCRFKKRYRNSDFTLWDCFDLNRFSEEAEGMDAALGVTCVLAHNEKAAALISKLSDELTACVIDPETLAASSREMTRSVSLNHNRENFFKDAGEMTGEQLFNKYFPVKLKNRAEDFIRRAACKTGLYHFIRKCAKRIIPSFKRY